MIGVPSSLFSGRGPRLSVFKRQATSSLLQLPALICSSGEYLLPFKSAVDNGKPTLLVLGCAGHCCWPVARGMSQTPTATSSAAAGTTRIAMRFMVLLKVKKCPKIIGQKTRRETGDGRRATGDGRREAGDGRRGLS